MKRAILIDGVAYSVASFSKKFGLSPAKVTKLYDQGLRGNKLLQELQNKQLTLDGKTFKSSLQAAKYFDIPPTTFYRYEKKGELDKLIKRKRVLDKYDLN